MMDEQKAQRLARRQVAVKLLAHGSLTRGEFVAITGWSGRQCDTVLSGLRCNGTVRAHYRHKRLVYTLPNAPYAGYSGCAP